MKTNQKYYIGKKDKITIRCLACKKKREIAVTDLIKLKQQSVKVVCPCSHDFSILLEFRQSYRKEIDIQGSCSKKSDSVEQKTPCRIRDISLGGLGISITKETTFQLEDELTVTFELGTSQQLEFNATIQIRHIDSSMNIGGAFVESSAEKHLEMATLFL